MFVSFIHSHCGVVCVGGRRRRRDLKSIRNHQLMDMCLKPFCYLCLLERKKTKFELGILRANELFLVLKVAAKLPKFKFKLRFFTVTKLFLGPREIWPWLFWTRAWTQILDWTWVKFFEAWVFWVNLEPELKLIFYFLFLFYYAPV
jgi:hypothetical protein